MHVGDTANKWKDLPWSDSQRSVLNFLANTQNCLTETNIVHRLDNTIRTVQHADGSIPY